RTAVFLARIVIPFSRSRSIVSSTRSPTSSFARNAPDCQSSASTRVVFPWSTCATIATLRMSSRTAISLHGSGGSAPFGSPLLVLSKGNAGVTCGAAPRSRRHPCPRYRGEPRVLCRRARAVGASNRRRRGRMVLRRRALRERRRDADGWAPSSVPGGQPSGRGPLPRGCARGWWDRQRRSGRARLPPGLLRRVRIGSRRKQRRGGLSRACRAIGAVGRLPLVDASAAGAESDAPPGCVGLAGLRLCSLSPSRQQPSQRLERGSSADDGRVVVARELLR